MAQNPAEIVIRLSRPEDERELDMLAALDSRRPLAAPILLAEADGSLRAALSLCDGAAIADPFHRTEALVLLLSARAGQLRPARSRRLRRLRRPLRLAPA